MKKLYYLIIAAVLIIITGCNSITDNEPPITHRPFKYEKTDRWGMIGVDGTVLFENEFENEPSCVLNGVFFVKNESGLYEYYTAEEKPKRIGNKEYVAASYFVEDVAPVVEPEQYITFIKKDGSLAFKLDKYKDKDIVSVSNFSDGLASFKTSDDLYGFVDTKGKIVIEPIYSHANSFSDGVAVVSIYAPYSYKDFVINKQGEQQFEIKVGNDISVRQPAKYHNGYLPIRRIILNKKGEEVYRFKQDNDNITGDVVNDKFLVSSNGKVCLMNMDGEMLIRPKYEDYYANLFNDYIIVKDNEKFGVIDLEDNILVPFEYDEILPFVGSNAFVRDRDEWFLIDKKAERVDRKQAFSKIGRLSINFNYEVASDYFDAQAYVELAMKPMTENSYAALQIGSTATVAAQRWTISDLEQYHGERSWRLKVNGTDSMVMDRILIPSYDESVVRAVVERESYGNYYWQTRDVVKGYNVNPNALVTQLLVEIVIKQSVRNENKRLGAALEKWMKSHNYTYSHNTDWNGSNWNIYITSNDYGLAVLNDESSYKPMQFIIFKR